ncbi:MAG TPA: methyltransferase [Solirubrobacteraceae bacterium]|nr:methyltransferase [Solirubrobacteraceae bacterium]
MAPRPRPQALDGLCSVLTTRYPHLQCTTYDLPVVAPIAEKAIAAAGLSDRLKVAAGDYSPTRCPQRMSSAWA